MRWHKNSTYCISIAHELHNRGEINNVSRLAINWHLLGDSGDYLALASNNRETLWIAKAQKVH